MVEISSGVYCGNQEDSIYGWRNNLNWAFIYCAKYPWHKKIVGYSGNGCPKDHPEYLYAIRGNSIALNLVDINNPDFFHIEPIKMAIAFAIQNSDRRLLFCCNRGMSRSPSLAMLYLAIIDIIPNRTFEDAEEAFKKIYPYYNPKDGIRGHLKQNWFKYTEV